MIKKYSNYLALFIFFSILSGISHAQSTIQGKVVGIGDGDTITALQDSKQYKISLHGVDSPEKKQSSKINF